MSVVGRRSLLVFNLVASATMIPHRAMAMQLVSPAEEIAVIRDITPDWKNSEGVRCVDPNVVSDPARTRAARDRWPLAELLRNSNLAVDTTAGSAPSGLRTCARSLTTQRLAYGHPRIAGDSGSITFIATRLDGRNQVDSTRFDLRLVKSNGTWTVPQVLSESESVHNYVHGEGCYRFSHPLFTDRFIERLRIDTVLVRADTARLTLYPDSRSRVLLPAADHVGLGGGSGMFPSSWGVSHDTLHLGWNASGFAGLSASLHVVGDSLSGVMRYWTDAIGPPEPTVPVVGHRVPCPSK